MTNEQFDKEHDSLTEYTKEHIAQKYPCGDSGWIHYRVLTEQHLNDIEKLIRLKVQK